MLELIFLRRGSFSRRRSAGWQIVDPTTAVRSSNTVLMTLPRLDAPRPLIPPQFSYNEAWQPISPTMRPMIPQPSPPHYHLASTTSRSNLHHLRWRAPGYNPNANVPGFVPLDPSLQRGGMQPEFRQGVLQPGQCGGSSAGPQFTAPNPMLSGRSEIPGPISFHGVGQESIQRDDHQKYNFMVSLRVLS